MHKEHSHQAIVVKVGECQGSQAKKEPVPSAVVFDRQISIQNTGSHTKGRKTVHSRFMCVDQHYRCKKDNASRNK